MEGFALLAEREPLLDAQLVLGGPNVHAIEDDPESVQTFNEVLERWRALPHHIRERVHLASLPMADLEENGAIVNALQRHAAIIVQKSLKEGFGLTVTEGMWKSRPWSPAPWVEFRTRLSTKSTACYCLTQMT